MLYNTVAGNIRDMNAKIREYNYVDEYVWGWKFDSFGLSDNEINEEIAPLNLEEDSGLNSFPESSSNVPIENVYPDDAHLWQLPYIDEEMPLGNELESVFGRRDFGTEIYFKFMKHNSGRDMLNDLASIFKKQKSNFKEEVSQMVEGDTFEDLERQKVRKEVLDKFDEMFSGVITEQGFVKRVKGVIRMKSRYEICHLNTEERSVYRTWTTFPMNKQKTHKSAVEFHHVHVEDLLALFHYAHKKDPETKIVVEHVNLAIDGIVPGIMKLQLIACNVLHTSSCKFTFIIIFRKKYSSLSTYVCHSI